MARFVDVIDLPVPVEDAFDTLADFSRTAEWDPGVVAAERLGHGPPGPGSRFRVTVSFLGRQLPLEYTLTAFERPARLVFEGGDAAVRSRDEITLVARPGGTRVTYEARLELSGIRRLADPLLHALLQRIGSLAVRGLREHAWASRTRSAGGSRAARRAAAGSSRRARGIAFPGGEAAP